MSNTVAFSELSLCYDCRTALPADARYDVCSACIRAQVSAERERDACWNVMPERQECRCGQHKAVR
jgi:hypothetical protein